MLGWDGQLEDDARLVTTVARTAASYGAHVRTRARVLTATGKSGQLRDELTGGTHTVTARTVVNAAGVWAGDLVDEIGCAPAGAPTWCCAPRRCPGSAPRLAPVPGSINRFVLVLPQPDGTVYVGLTDEPVEGPVPDVPEPTEPEIGFLLDVVSAAFERPLHRSDVVGAFAGLRPLLDARHRRAPPTSPAGTRLTSRPAWSRSSAASSRRTAGWPRTPSTPRSRTPASTPARAGPAPCRCSARPTAHPGGLEQPPRLVRQFGTDAGAGAGHAARSPA